MASEPFCVCGHPQDVHVIQMGRGIYGCAHGLWSDKECACIQYRAAPVAQPESSPEEER